MILPVGRAGLDRRGNNNVCDFRRGGDLVAGGAAPWHSDARFVGYVDRCLFGDCCGAFCFAVHITFDHGAGRRCSVVGRDRVICRADRGLWPWIGLSEIAVQIW